MSRYLTNLADVVRRSGLAVHEVDGWKTRGHGPMDDSLQTITCHHTAGPANGDHPSLTTVVEGRPNLAGPLSHLLLARSGDVYVVAAGLCWHAGASRESRFNNRYAIGIEAEATGAADWPDVQMDAYARLCAALVRGYALSVDDVRGHKETCDPPGRKVDPNFDMALFRARVADVLRDGQPAAHGTPFGLSYPLKRGMSGKVVETLQTRLTQLGYVTKVDGDFGPRTESMVKTFQRSRNLAADGVVGAATARALGWRWVD